METLTKLKLKKLNLKVVNIYDETGNIIGKVLDNNSTRIIKIFDKIF